MAARGDYEVAHFPIGQHQAVMIVFRVGQPDVQAALAKLYGPLEIFHGNIKPAQIPIDQLGHGINPKTQLGLDKCPLVVARRPQINREIQMVFCLALIEAQGSTEIPLRGRPIPLVKKQSRRPLKIGLGQSVI